MASVGTEIISLLKYKRLTIAVAESCTGGLVTTLLVDVPGCSEVYRESFITYSNEAKTARLSVKKELIDTYGAVSEQVAAAMAEGAAKASGTDIGLSVTGVAGPDGGTPEKPVGLVYVGLYVKGKKTVTVKHHQEGSRNIIRTRAAIFALDFLRRKLRD